MSRLSENVKAWRKRTKKRLVEAFGGKCCLCNKIFPPELYDFHHIDPKTKKFSLGAARGSITSWKNLVEEVRKCVMLCANCHRLIEHGYKKLPDNVPRFDESFEKYESVKEILPKYANHNCPVCGSNKVLRRNTYCSSSCAGIAGNRIKNKPPIEEIKKLVEDNGWVQTGRMFGVTESTVRHWVARAK